jgi:hypothetical protein
MMDASYVSSIMGHVQISQICTDRQHPAFHPSLRLFWGLEAGSRYPPYQTSMKKATSVQPAAVWSSSKNFWKRRNWVLPPAIATDIMRPLEQQKSRAS